MDTDTELMAAQAAWDRASRLADDALRACPLNTRPWTPKGLLFTPRFSGPSPWARAAQGDRAARSVESMDTNPAIVRLAQIAIGTVDLPCCFDWRGATYRAVYRGSYPGTVERVGRTGEKN